MRSRRSTVASDRVEPERWSVEIDDEAEELAEVPDIDLGSPVAVNAPERGAAPESDTER
jgi:hypothetical protein